ncbi:rhodanese-like domain-containing protein [Alicyclobacillus mengziensis]|uniref:Rhodanese-like domain-containing protein n=1 Tax=Alicyclobacillus mengziensis TaxID=2931921 RepID=A0A9X7VV58_9BACL|nr:rhodanese-like domain-containing protein [Alicyclobacillus mengziensis]QSO45759.1 rhodanese-like domain-containing protein [Alicyclobacillus mengziensis]
MSFETEGIRQLNKNELQQRLQDSKTQVIDVRTVVEYEEGHIPNVPNRPMQEVERWSKELSPDASYVFVCRSGGRSQKVAQFFKHAGFKDIANFSGGMLGWDGEIRKGAQP